MPVKIYNGTSFTQLQGAKIFYNGNWITLSSSDKMYFNGDWYALGTTSGTTPISDFTGLTISTLTAVYSG